jgi:hypothetical protein
MRNRPGGGGRTDGNCVLAPSIRTRAMSLVQPDKRAIYGASETGPESQAAGEKIVTGVLQTAAEICAESAVEG